MKERGIEEKDTRESRNEERVMRRQKIETKKKRRRTAIGE